MRIKFCLAYLIYYTYIYHISNMGLGKKYVGQNYNALDKENINNCVYTIKSGG